MLLPEQWYVNFNTQVLMTILFLCKTLRFSLVHTIRRE